MNPQLVKLGRVHRAMAEARLDLLLVNGPANVWYLSGYPLALSGLQGRGYGRNASVLLPVGGEPVLVPGFFEEQISRARAWTVDIEPFSDYVQIPVVAAAEIARRRGFALGRVGIEWEHLSAHFANALAEALPESQLVPADALLDELRAVKDAQETAGIEGTYARGAAAMREVLGQTSAGAAEVDVHNRLTVAMMRALWSEKVDGSVLSDSRIAEWNGQAGPRRLSAGDWVRLEYTCAAGGYPARLCRMGTVGQPSVSQADQYERYLDAAREGLRAVRPGILGSGVFKAFHTALVKRGLEPAGGAVGFGLGYAPVERPYLAAQERWPLQEGMVLSVEPSTREGFRANWIVVVGRAEPNSFEAPMPADKLFSIRAH